MCTCVWRDTYLLLLCLSTGTGLAMSKVINSWIDCEVRKTKSQYIQTQARTVTQILISRFRRNL